MAERRRRSPLDYRLAQPQPPPPPPPPRCRHHYKPTYSAAASISRSQNTQLQLMQQSRPTDEDDDQVSVRRATGLDGREAIFLLVNAVVVLARLVNLSSVWRACVARSLQVRRQIAASSRQKHLLLLASRAAARCSIHRSSRSGLRSQGGLLLRNTTCKLGLLQILFQQLLLLLL